MRVIYSNLVGERVTVAQLNNGCVTTLRCSRFPRIMRSRPSAFGMRRPA